MKEIALRITDEKYSFFMAMISELNYVEVKKKLDKSKTAADLKEAFTELAEVQAGRKQATSFDAFLKELSSSKP